MKKQLLSLGIAPVVLFAAACSVEDTDEIIENAVEAQGNLESYYAEVSSSFEFDGVSEEDSYKEWSAKPNKHRIEQDGFISVSNGEQSWSYNEEENSVIVFDDIGEWSEEMPDESEMMREMLTEMMGSNDVVAHGKETVADRSVIHLSLTPKEGEEEFLLGDGSYEVWVDEETYMPLKMKMEGEEFSSEMEYTHIEYNIDIDEEIFEFDIPEGAELQSMDDLMPESLSIDELQEVTAFDVPEFTKLPDGYEFQGANYLEEMDSAMIEYIDSEGNYLMLSISSESTDFSLEGEESESLEIGEHEGTYMSMHQMQFITWSDGDLHYELSSFAEDMTKEELVEVAKGLK
ncbi:DUF4367 domain-containing protein [Alteribacter populi]|uniref:DUF4367 domain-containing protein n=1 Tax=Alteribacter populi TaxID=2011011 RepID=UPI000BBA7110|nr:DUF4367 domain-containing protein [Alteribacter populi]